MANTNFALVFSAISLALAGCSGEDAGAKKTVETQPLTAESSPTAAAIENAASPAEQAAPQVQPRAPSPEFASLPAPYSDASYSIGKRTYKTCSSCHTIADGGPNIVGPNLYGIFGKQVGSADGFSYSTAVQEAEFIWTPEKLEAWLESPRNFLPGNRMTFSGVRKPADRKAVVAYLMVETGWEPAQ